MANRLLQQFHYSIVKMPVELYSSIAIGASGAPTIVNSGSAPTSQGIASVVRNSAGKYTITLQDPYNSLLNVHAIFNSGASAPAAPIVNIVSQAVSTAAAPTVVIQCRDLSGVAADPASGETLIVNICVKNSAAV
jgi:hypothetical protein